MQTASRRLACCTCTPAAISLNNPAPRTPPPPLLQDDQGTVIGTMDPQGNLTEIFIREFDNRYNGNRAPVGM